MLNSNPEATSSSVLGPFHVSGAPPLAIGGDMKRDFDGPLLLAEGVVRDIQGNPIPHAELDIWQTAPNGLYASQDDEQDTYSFHGLMTVGEDGRYAFTTAKPAEYTVPSDGPVGAILNACGRHPWRPSHLHYIVKAKGFRTLVTEIFPEDDPYLDQDTVFGVRNDLVMRYVEKPASEFPEGMVLSGKVKEPFLHVNFDVTLAPE
jgi:hydroxyquinol 1,2-dioxygenase